MATKKVYKTFDLRSLKELKRAEWHKARGWVVDSITITDQLTMYKIKEVTK